MPGIFDFLGGLFGGGDSGDTDAFGLIDPSSTFDSSGSLDGFSIDPSTYSFGDPSSAFGDGSVPLNLVTSDPGLTPTGGVDLTGLTGNTAAANPLTALTGTSAGSPIPLQSLANPLAAAASGSPNNPDLTGLSQVGATSGTNPLAGLTTGGSTNPLQSILGSNGGGVLGSGISLSQLLAGAGGLAGLFTSSSLGPAADSLTSMANANQTLVNDQILPTALANQQGDISGPALDAIAQKLGQNQAGVRGAYGGMDMSGSTMEAQDLAAQNLNARNEAFQESQAMAATGMQEATNLSGQDAGIYQNLMNAQVSQDNALQAAIARVAAAFAGGSPAAAGAGS